MCLKDIVNNGLKNQDKVVTRYFITRLQGFDAPLFVELSSDDNYGLDIKIYETDLRGMNGYIKPFLENPFHKESIINEIMFGTPMDSENPNNPRPVCEITTKVWGDAVTITNVQTREDVRRKGLASFALKIVQDYYSRNVNIKDKLTKMSEEPTLYSSKHLADENLQYRTRFELQTGAFGELLSRVNAKIFARDSHKAYNNFLKSNHFRCDKSDYCMPSRPMRRRNIMSDEIINEDTARNHIQVFDGVIEYNLADFVNDKVK